MNFKNVESWKHFIKNKSIELGVEPHELQQAFLLECFAKKIAASKYKDDLVFKGGFIMSSIIGIDTRSTRDIDLTWKSNNYSTEEIEEIIKNLNKIDIGISINFEIKNIKESSKPNGSTGFQVTLNGTYETMWLSMKLDISNGTLVYPDAIQYKIKSNFDNQLIEVKSYSIENIIAEKFETILDRGETNGRMRDFFDIYMIQKIGYEVNRRVLCDTLSKVSIDRGTSEELYNCKNILKQIEHSDYFKTYWNDYCNIQSKANEIDLNDLFTCLYEIGNEFELYLYKIRSNQIMSRFR